MQTCAEKEARETRQGSRGQASRRYQQLSPFAFARSETGAPNRRWRRAGQARKWARPLKATATRTSLSAAKLSAAKPTRPRSSRTRPLPGGARQPSIYQVQERRLQAARHFRLVAVVAARGRLG